MDLYRWVDYMSETPIFQPKTKKGKIYKDKSNTIYTFFLMIIDFQSNKALFWKELLFWLFAADLSVNTDTDILIVQSNGKKNEVDKTSLLSEGSWSSFRASFLLWSQWNFAIAIRENIIRFSVHVGRFAMYYYFHHRAISEPLELIRHC